MKSVESICTQSIHVILSKKSTTVQVYNRLVLGRTDFVALTGNLSIEINIEIAGHTDKVYEVGDDYIVHF